MIVGLLASVGDGIGFVIKLGSFPYRVLLYALVVETRVGGVGAVGEEVQ